MASPVTTPAVFVEQALNADVRLVDRRRFLQLLGAIAASPYASSAAAAQSGEGVVTGISDGDTCYMVLDGKKVRVRLAEIDAPEKGQAFGRRSEQSLRELIADKRVRVVWSDVDRYGRLIAHVYVDGVDVSSVQVQRGFAWVYRQYSSNPQLLRFEDAARSAQLGLWADAHPLEPWVWRRQQKKDQPLG